MEYLADTEGGAIGMRALQTGCLFCGSTDATEHVHGKAVCGTCCRQAGVLVENRREAVGD